MTLCALLLSADYENVDTGQSTWELPLGHSAADVDGAVHSSLRLQWDQGASSPAASTSGHAALEANAPFHHTR